MKSSPSAQLSSESRLLLDAYKNMMNVSDPITSTPVLNDNFLSILSSKIIEPKTSEEKQLCLLSLNILGWILSCVSCSDDVDEAVSVSQKNFIHSNVRIQSCFSKVIALMNEEKQHVDVMNLCLFVVMEQCTPDLLRGHLSIIVQAIARSIGITGIHAHRNQPFEEQSWKQPIIACSALCTLLEQVPDEVLSRHAVWAADVFLLLVESFSHDSSHTNLSCSSNTINTASINPALNESKAGDFSPSSYCADVDSRLLPLAVSATRLLHYLPVEILVPLLPIALSSYEAAVKHICDLLRTVGGRKQRDNKDGKGQGQGQGQGQDAISRLTDAPHTLNQRSSSSSSAAGASGIALASYQGHQSVTSPSHCSVPKGVLDCSKIAAGAACESDGLVLYCGLLWRIYVKALSCMVTMTDRDMHDAQQMPSTVSAISAARELKAVEGIVDADADADGEELDSVGDLRSNAESGMIARGAMVGQRVAQKGRERCNTGDALAIPVRPCMGSRASKGAPGPLIELSLQSNGPVLVPNMGLRAGRDSKGHGQVQVQERSKGAVLYASLIAPDKAAGVLTQALRLLYKHPVETVNCLSVLTEAILLDTGWRVRTSPLKVLLRLLTPFLQHAKHKGKGKGREKGNEKKQINVSGNENQTARCIETADEEKSAREKEEVEGALEEMEAFLVAADCLRKVVSMTSRHSSQMLRLGGPSTSSSSSSSTAAASTAASTSNGVPLPAPVGTDHPSAVGGILLYLLQSRPVPAEPGAPKCSPALSVLRDCMAYERALKGVQCTAALFDGLRDLLSLSSSSPSPSTIKSTSVEAPVPVPSMLSSDKGNVCSTEACRAVAEHGLFAQRAGSPEGRIARTPALEVLQCLSRLPDCFVLLNAAHSHSLRRQRTGVNIGDALKCAERGGGDGGGDVGDVKGGRSGLRGGRHEERLHAEVLVTLHALLSAWQLGVNAIGRHFTGMEVTEEGEMGAQAQAQHDSQRSTSAFSQSASQRFSAGKSQYGVSQQGYPQRRRTRNSSSTYQGREGDVRAISSQLLCTYDGESHPVLREESESDSVEEVLQRVFSLVVVVWVTFWSPRRHENQGQGGQGQGQGRGQGQGHSQADGRSIEEEEEEGEGAGRRAAAIDVHLGPVSSRARGLFLESVWWLLHRVSGFAFEVPPADWEALLGVLDRDIPTQHCPQTMAGAAMLLSVSHARMIREEAEYNQYKESIARAVSSGVPPVIGLDIASKGEGACACASRWLDWKHDSGTCMCALRWAVSRCTNGIVESGALVGLLQWFPVLLASPPRIAPHVSQYSLSLQHQHLHQHQHQVHEGLQKKTHMVDRHGHFLYERTIAVDDRAVSDFILSFLWGAFKHLSCMTPPSTAEDLTQETLDSMTAGLKNLLTAPLIIMASGHSGMGLLGSKDDVLPPTHRDLIARDGGDRNDVMGDVDIEDVHAADGFRTNARDVEESGRSRWKLLFSWWLDLDQRLAEQRRLCALMPPPTPIFSPTSDMEMEMELGRSSDGDGVEIDMHTLAFTQFLSLPASNPRMGEGMGEGMGMGGEGAQDSPYLVSPVMQYGGVIAHGGHGRGQGRAPCRLDDLHASLDYITLASEAFQDHMDKMSSGRKSATFDQQSAARMALPNCLIERLILVYLNVVGGWCAALKSNISMEQHCDKEEEVEDREEEGTEREGEGVVGETAGEMKRVREQGVEGDKESKSLRSPGKFDSADLEPRFADLAAVDRILAVLTQSPLGSWVLKKRAPNLALATHGDSASSSKTEKKHQQNQRQKQNQNHGLRKECDALLNVSMGISVIIDAPIPTNAYGSTTGSYHPPSPYSATSANHSLSPAPHTHLHEPLHPASASASLLRYRMRSHTAGLADGLEEDMEEREGGDKRQEGGLPPRAPALYLTRSACKSFTLGDRQSGSPMGLLFALLFEPLSAALDLGSGAGTATAPSSSGTRDRRTASELSSTSHGSNSSSSSSKIEGGLPWRRVMKHRLSVFSSAKKWVIKLLTTASLMLGAVERRGSACTAAELRAVVLAFLRRHWIDFFCETGGTEKMASPPPPYGADKRSSDTHRSEHQRSEDRLLDCDYSELREYALAAWRECGGGAHPAITRPLAHFPGLFSSPSPTPHPVAPTSDNVQLHSGFPKSASRVEQEKGERSKQSRSTLVVGLDRDLQEHLEGAGKRARQGRAMLTGTGVDRLNVNTQSQQTDEDGTDKVVQGEEQDEAPLAVSAAVNGGQEAADTANFPSLMNIGQATDGFCNKPCELDRNVEVEFVVAVEVEVEVEVESMVGVRQGVDVAVHESNPSCGKEGIAMETEGVQVHEENSVVDLTSPITTAAVFEGLSPVSKSTPVCAADAPLPLPLPPLSGSCEGSKCTVWEAESTGPGLPMGPSHSHTRLADLTTIPPLLATPDTSATKAALALSLACSPRDKEATPPHPLQLPVTTSPPPVLPSSPSSSPPSHIIRDRNVESNADSLVPPKPHLPMDPSSQPLPPPPPPPQSQSARGSFPFTPPTSNMRRDAISSTNSDADTSRTSPTLTASVDPSHRLSLSVPLSTARLEERPLVEPFLYLLPSQRELFSRSQNSAVRNSQELARTGEAECGSGSVRGVITIGADEVPLDDAEESKIEEISSQLVFLPHRASRNNNNNSSSSSSSGVPHSSTLRVGRSFEVVHEGGRSKKRMLHGSQDQPRLSQEVEGYNVKRTLNGYIATADSVASSLMSVLNCTDGEGRYGSELKRLRNSVPDSAEMGIVVGGVAVAGDPVMRCSSPLTLIREALEANHRVNGRLLELSRRYQEDLVL